MAHFIGYVRGKGKTEASRLGTAHTGIHAQAQGWGIGGQVSAHEENGKDVVAVFATAGSTGDFRDISIGSISRDGFGDVTFTPSKELAEVLGCEQWEVVLKSS